MPLSLLLLLLLQAKKQKAAELEVRRKEHVRAAIMGQNFIEGERDTSTAEICKEMTCSVRQSNSTSKAQGLFC